MMIRDIFEAASNDEMRPWEQRVQMTLLVLLGHRCGLWSLPAAYAVPAAAVLAQQP